MTTGSLEARQAAADKVRKTVHLVTLDHLLSLIVDEEYWHPECCPTLTVCVLKVKNGFTFVGKAGVVDPKNFDPDLGRNFAREDAVKKMWSYEGYLLANRLSLIGDPS